ncbi:hypothetical protein PanWU01x14_370460 [Parasponia andersonii]|uniref:Uncharacterized protein n=1 Tax=Parasponia andersonii TaxID=3476 RepID=A0A2P5A4B3_PARAD|nr:hypothetical protein PanWU01x14_370460 [Parasponia andersonii]
MKRRDGENLRPKALSLSNARVFQTMRLIDPGRVVKQPPPIQRHLKYLSRQYASIHQHLQAWGSILPQSSISQSWNEAEHDSRKEYISLAFVLRHSDVEKAVWCSGIKQSQH